jgi:hypothetical protein
MSTRAHLSTPVGRQFGIDLARHTPRVAGQSYGISSIPSLPSPRHPHLGLRGHHLDGGNFDAHPVRRPDSRRGHGGGGGSARQPQPPRGPPPSGALRQPRQVGQAGGGGEPMLEQELQLRSELEKEYDTGALTLDIMMPIYAEVERKRIKALDHAEQLESKLSKLHSKNDELVGVAAPGSACLAAHTCPYF